MAKRTYVLLTTTHTTTITMPQGQAVSEAIQWIIVRLSTAMPPDEIAEFTDLSDRKVRDILDRFVKTGAVKVQKRERPSLHRSLQDEDIQVRLLISIC